MICWKRDENNIWDLENRFDSSSLYFKDIGVNDTISWKEQTQYLDFKNEPSRKVSLEAFLNGDHKGFEYISVRWMRRITKRGENSIKTEKGHANIVKFWSKILTPFNRYINDDYFSWVLSYRSLCY